jgi:hypothetical protein
MGVVLRLFRRKPDVSLFDPRERTVREVLAYLRENPGDKTRVQELEKLNKARKTILAK